MFNKLKGFLDHCRGIIFRKLWGKKLRKYKHRDEVIKYFILFLRIYIFLRINYFYFLFKKGGVKNEENL